MGSKTLLDGPSPLSGWFSQVDYVPALPRCRGAAVRLTTEHQDSGFLLALWQSPAYLPSQARGRVPGFCLSWPAITVESGLAVGVLGETPASRNEGVHNPHQW